MSDKQDFDQDFQEDYPLTAALANEPVGFDDIEFVDDDPIQWPEVSRVEFDVISTIDDVTSLSEGLDVLAGTFGRFGLDGFTILAKDADNPERSWVLKNGRLYTTEEFVAEFEGALDEEEIDKQALTEEEADAIRKADLPVTSEAVNDDEDSD